MLTFIRYIDENFTFALTVWIVFVITIEDYVKARFVKSSFCSIHFTVILAWLKKIVRYIKDFVMFLKSPFGEVTINVFSRVKECTLLQCFAYECVGICRVSYF